MPCWYFLCGLVTLRESTNPANDLPDPAAWRVREIVRMFPPTVGRPPLTPRPNVGIAVSLTRVPSQVREPGLSAVSGCSSSPKSMTRVSAAYGQVVRSQRLSFTLDISDKSIFLLFENVYIPLGSMNRYPESR